MRPIPTSFPDAGPGDKPVVLVTGCTAEGLSTVLCQQFLLAGCAVFASSSKSENLPAINNLKHLVFDEANPEAAERAVSEIISQAGRIDILVNTSQMLLSGALLETDLAAAKLLFDTHLFSLMCVTQAVAVHMVNQRGGRIITLGSSGWSNPPFASLYNASKAAVDSFTKSIRLELRPFKVQVSCVAVSVTKVTSTPTSEADSSSKAKLTSPKALATNTATAVSKQPVQPTPRQIVVTPSGQTTETAPSFELRSPTAQQPKAGKPNPHVLYVGCLALPARSYTKSPKADVKASVVTFAPVHKKAPGHQQASVGRHSAPSSAPSSSPQGQFGSASHPVPSTRSHDQQTARSFARSISVPSSERATPATNHTTTTTSKHSHGSNSVTHPAGTFTGLAPPPAPSVSSQPPHSHQSPSSSRAGSSAGGSRVNSVTNILTSATITGPSQSTVVSPMLDQDPNADASTTISAPTTPSGSRWSLMGLLGSSFQYHTINLPACPVARRFMSECGAPASDASQLPAFTPTPVPAANSRPVAAASPDPASSTSPRSQTSHAAQGSQIQGGHDAVEAPKVNSGRPSSESTAMPRTSPNPSVSRRSPSGPSVLSTAGAGPAARGSTAGSAAAPGSRAESAVAPASVVGPAALTATITPSASAVKAGSAVVTALQQADCSMQMVGGTKGAGSSEISLYGGVPSKVVQLLPTALHSTAKSEQQKVAKKLVKIVIGNSRLPQTLVLGSPRLSWMGLPVMPQQFREAIMYRWFKLDKFEAALHAGKVVTR